METSPKAWTSLVLVGALVSRPADDNYENDAFNLCLTRSRAVMVTGPHCDDTELRRVLPVHDFGRPRVLYIVIVGRYVQTCAMHIKEQ